MARRSTMAGRAGVALVLSLVAGGTQAQPACEPADRISGCVSADHLWPEPGLRPFVSQAATELPDRYDVAVGVAAVYVDQPIRLVTAAANSEGSISRAVAGALRAHVLAGFAVADETLVDVVAPITVYQWGAGKADVVGSDATLAAAAMGDLRFGVQRGFLSPASGEDGVSLAARFQVALPTAPDSTFTGFATTTFAPGMTFAYRLGRVELGADLAGRFRDARRLAGIRIGTQLVPSLGVSVDAIEDGWLSVAAEAWALFGVYEQTPLTYIPSLGRAVPFGTGQPHIPAEWMVSVRTTSLLERRLQLRLGGGGFIPTAGFSPVTTPRFRVMASAQAVFDPY